MKYSFNYNPITGALTVNNTYNVSLLSGELREEIYSQIAKNSQDAENYRRVLELVLADIDDDPDKVRGITIKTISEIRKVLE